MAKAQKSAQVRNRWWRGGSGRTIFQTSPDSPILGVISRKLKVTKVAENTYAFTAPKTHRPDAIFSSLNANIRKSKKMQAAGVEEFRRVRSGVARTIAELQTMKVADFDCVHDFAKPGNVRKKKGYDVVKELEKVGIETAFDALMYLPRRYIDRTNPVEDFSGLYNEDVIIVGTVTNVNTSRGSRIPRTIVSVRLKKRTIDVVFFRQPWLSKKFHAGDSVIISGKFQEYRGQDQISGKSISKETSNSKPIVPIYKQKPMSGLTTAFFEQLVEEALIESGRVVPPAFMDGEVGSNLISLFRRVHFPQQMKDVDEAGELLALYELTLLQGVFAARNAANKEKGETVKSVVSKPNKDNPLLEKMIRHHMPFTLTKDQTRGVQTLIDAMASGNADNILLSADVGAGKTIVAQLAALRAVEAGHQAAIAAPTGVLAEQLYRKTAQLFEPFPEVKVGYITGSLKAAERKELESKVRSGEINIVVGTHVVLSHYEMYKSLAFACIDEQHKFGAAQRTAISKAMNTVAEDGKSESPVVMQQTATPIPRSMAQTLFGGMTIIRLLGKPAGRLPIKTRWARMSPSGVLKKRNNSIWRLMQSEIDKGNQAFIIAPFVTDSQFMEDVSSVESLNKDLKKLLPELRIAMIHGKMKAEEIDNTMNDVRAKKYDVVVASTVVEVGVDIPDATFIAIFSADRLGIASLHQLRGRVGRNSKQSYCVLVSNSASEKTEQRLTAMENTNDGFELAEEDLRTRGAGLLLGSKQSGDSELRFAVEHVNQEMIEHAGYLAQKAVSDNADIAEEAMSYFGSGVFDVGGMDLMI